MIDITVKVPEDRVGEFYTWFGAWLSGPPQGPPPTGTGGSGGTRDAAEWSESDIELAAEVWEKFSDTAQMLFSTLIDEPKRRFSGDELSEMLAIPNGRHGVAGVLAWPGRHCVAVDRELPWKWTYPVEGEPVVYWFTPENAALFRAARDGQF
jgi:hypothetical protein